MVLIQLSTYFFVFLLTLLHSSVLYGQPKKSWDGWWNYQGISGPDWWGRFNPNWNLCFKGARQSPINLDPKKLLFDPNLGQIYVDTHRIDGKMINTGHSIIFQAGNDSHVAVNITGGPLSYRYRFHEIHIHYGMKDDKGSEHAINGYVFPAEIQVFGYNSQLYSNFSEASYKAQGIAAISLLLQLGDSSHPELRRLTEQIGNITFRGDEVDVKQVSIAGLLPKTNYYITYDGSITIPACFETVTWLVLNKPIYVTKQQLHALRNLMQGYKSDPPEPLGDNFRPVRPLNDRPLRTNIDFNLKEGDDKSNCRPSMFKEVYYKAKMWTSEENILSSPNDVNFN